MRRLVISILIALVWLGGMPLIVPPSSLRASSDEGVVQLETFRASGGQPDNDHTPIYGAEGQLLYPIYHQQGSFSAMSLAAGADDRSCGLRTPVANGRYGDVMRSDNWARVSVSACEDKLVGVAWSAWPGRDPIHTDHDRQALWIKAKVTDLTTGRIVDSLDLHLTNNPREEGVLFHVYEFKMPADGHRYALWMWAKMRQDGCGNGQGGAEDEVEAIPPPAEEVEPEEVEPMACVLEARQLEGGDTLINLGAIDRSGRPASIEAWQAHSNFGFVYPQPTSPSLLPVSIKFPAIPGRYWVQFKVLSGESWLGGDECRIERRHEVPKDFPQGQYQDFVGAVPFGTFTPYLEPGKEYFDGVRSLMYNAEYIDEGGRAEIVFRFNGEEVSGITTSIFNAGNFRQSNSSGGRDVTELNEGVTKLIAYRYDVEQARIFQAFSSIGSRWIRPLDQPFEHKYQFELEIHGPPGISDLLIYHDYQVEIDYDDDGRALVQLEHARPGLVAVYEKADATTDVQWIAVDWITYPFTNSQMVTYEFSEAGLYHYRIVDHLGQVVAAANSSPHLEFVATPGVAYRAELAYPTTSLFVGLYDDMQFKHPPYWLMPIDGAAESVFEFHLDYQRNTQGDVVVDQLYLLNAGLSAAQAFPYGRHDAVLPGVKLVGIPDVNMVAFCQPPGMHAVAYWGDWEGGSYSVQERYIIFDHELYREWSEGARGDCFDAAQRVNMELARQGLRTDHTHRHHGEQSQGYQMAHLRAWSSYNLAGMRPPHVGNILKRGTVLPYYSATEDLLFWGWDLEKGSLADGLGGAKLQDYIESLGPVEYVDQTGLHPPES